jgi:hypothetical protein
MPGHGDTFRLHRIVASQPRPERRLEARDVGWVVMVHAEGAGYEVAFVTLGGETISVVTLPALAVRPGRQRKLPTRGWWREDQPQPSWVRGAPLSRGGRSPLKRRIALPAFGRLPRLQPVGAERSTIARAPVM